MIILNTCAFIDAAIEETREQVALLKQMKAARPDVRMIIAGCYVERFQQGIISDEPWIDALITPPCYSKIGSLIYQLYQSQCSRAALQTNYLSLVRDTFHYDHRSPRLGLTYAHTAYIKIAEGCDNCCSYCSIPLIKGSYRSRPFSSLISEAEGMAQAGVKEVILIAQDTGWYGKEKGAGAENKDIADLVQTIAQVSGISWIRLLYTHPAHVSRRIIDVMSQEQKLVKYLDIPLQHCDNDILTGMNRHISEYEVKSLIYTLRSSIPHIALRTTFLVGFPGEDDRKFKKLIDFVKDIAFERLGVFSYSPQPGTSAYKTAQTVPAAVAQERVEQLLEVQSQISLKKNKQLIGKTLDVIVDEKAQDQKGYYSGRSQADAPDVDNRIFFRSQSQRKQVPGTIVQVTIRTVEPYDMYGIVL